jgi:hypothetical protein
MSKVSFRTGMIALAIGLVTASCGGGSSKQTGAEKEAQKIVEDVVKKAGIKETVTENWPDNEYTKQLSKPGIDIKVAGIAEWGGSKVFSVTFADGTTKEQIKACIEKVKSDGFNKDASESDSGDAYYMYSAANSAGYGVVVSWAPRASGLMVSKK